jgi:hypothetical protein
MTPGSTSVLRRLFMAAAQLLPDRPCPHQEALARSGQHGAAPAALEQDSAERGFQFAQAAAERGLCDADRRRSAMKAAVCGDRSEPGDAGSWVIERGHHWDVSVLLAASMHEPMSAGQNQRR